MGARDVVRDLLQGRAQVTKDLQVHLSSRDGESLRDKFHQAYWWIVNNAVISPYYDSLIAKLIVHGRDRAEAVARMRRAVGMFVVEGIKTSLPLHQRILADPDFEAGRMDTHFIERLGLVPGK